ncbi:Uncharacterised protein [Mycobacterium tuberculosis]|uniref:Uncharacterized protein n=1 Tax=Mycobacterium tuberculosis TaxID=1773 RepID=A0A0T9BVQ2_MYCTX|nr:Uncharacterised protein [Mycobacterium tuberculosis]CFE52229.1 Uncharacterised protein [Mycobacterium tuberculosis]CKQ30546.1 Uncharacterised protein [Mycobacterium tuberculosis]CKR20740.1 Uncharacterised protein [Mycobacterium tuberculosis]CKU95876.1 Uncharacterised protein [Mycobacterium tuberculosis]
MTCVHIGLAGVAQFFQRVPTHRFQQPVPRAALAVVGHHQRLVYQQGQLIKHRKRIQVATGGDRPHRGEVEPADKWRQSPKQDLLGLGQQCMRPIDRGAKCLLALHRAPHTAGQQPETVVQTVGNLER